MGKQVSQPKKRKRIRKHGFMKRMSSPKGKKVISRRRTRGRIRLSI